MPSSTWTPAEEALAETLTAQGLDSAQIAERFRDKGIRRTQKAIQRKRARMGWHAQVPVSPMPRFNAPLRVEGDALILADVHVPFQDAAWMDRVLTLALRWGVGQCILAGDFASFDSFSHFQRQRAIDAEMELDALGEVMDVLCGEFEMWYFAGNHDTRPVKRLKDTGLNVHRFMELFTPSDRCHISDYYWCELVSGRTKYRIEHPKNASINATIVPKKLATKYRCSVIGAHGHVWGMTRDASARDWAIDAGVCCDPGRLAYVAQHSNTRPALYQGAVIVQDGTPVLLGPDNIGLYERLVS